MVSLTINGEKHDLDVPDDMPLLWAIRDVVGLTGTKFGCGVAQCGCCTVHLDDAAVRSCVTPVSAAAGKSITTIEALGTPEQPHALQQAWIDEEVPQCGYCQSGQLMAISGLLKTNPHPTDADLSKSITNICRCGTYGRIRKAVARATGGGQAS
ncbi:MAG TPA: (2Fe-2S)-binding protein [Alphaproteobacteria bacterium]|nr:(2Fe-2S)-binding protein [Alphaproteobacteria bacterium]